MSSAPSLQTQSWRLSFASISQLPSGAFFSWGGEGSLRKSTNQKGCPFFPWPLGIYHCFSSWRLKMEVAPFEPSGDLETLAAFTPEKLSFGSIGRRRRRRRAGTPPRRPAGSRRSCGLLVWAESQGWCRVFLRPLNHPGSLISKRTSIVGAFRSPGSGVLF